MILLYGLLFLMLYVVGSIPLAMLIGSMIHFGNPSDEGEV